jgi:hypothetical protein
MSASLGGAACEHLARPRGERRDTLDAHGTLGARDKGPDAIMTKTATRSECLRMSQPPFESAFAHELALAGGRLVGGRRFHSRRGGSLRHRRYQRRQRERCSDQFMAPRWMLPRSSVLTGTPEADELLEVRRDAAGAHCKDPGKRTEVAATDQRGWKPGGCATGATRPPEAT